MTEDLTPGVRPREPEPTAEPEPAAEAEPTAEPEPTDRSKVATGRIELYLLRHADAGDPMAWKGPDEERPLSGRGRKQAKQLGAFLDGAGFKPDAILTSPKVRAVETAKLVAKPLKVKTRIDPRLAFGVSLDELRRVVDAVPEARRVVLVGHDPDFSELLSLLTGSQLQMTKGAMARIDIDRPLQADTGELRWLVPPAMLKRS